MNRSGAEQVAGVVVLYNPAQDVLDNILSYLPQVGVLIAVDNSETPDPEFVRSLSLLPGVRYISNGGNLGIARALNTGARLAMADGYGYLLTMDQDSRAVPGMVSVLLQKMRESAFAGTGIAAPFHLTKPGGISIKSGECRKVLYVMTSGNLLDLQAYQAVGGFREELFIDFVDVEYCLRLNQSGYSVLQVPGTYLDHRVGDLVDIGFFRLFFRVTSHSPIRMYYKTRNRLLVTALYRKRFPAFWWRDKLRFCLEFCRLILFEPDKRAKVAMLMRGWLDYRRGKYGKFDQRGA